MPDHHIAQRQHAVVEQDRATQSGAAASATGQVGAVSPETALDDTACKVEIAHEQVAAVDHEQVERLGETVAALDFQPMLARTADADRARDRGERVLQLDHAAERRHDDRVDAGAGLPEIGRGVVVRRDDRFAQRDMGVSGDGVVGRAVDHERVRMHPVAGAGEHRRSRECSNQAMAHFPSAQPVRRDYRSAVPFAAIGAATAAMPAWRRMRSRKRSW